MRQKVTMANRSEGGSDHPDDPRWARGTGITWELVESAELDAPPRTHRIRSCILTKPAGGPMRVES